jgi:hypothetical protein
MLTSTQSSTYAAALASFTRVSRTCRSDDELVSRVRRPHNTMERCLLDEAVGKVRDGRGRGHLPAPRPTTSPFTRSPRLWPTIDSFAYRCLREAFVILRASGGGWPWVLVRNFANNALQEVHIKASIKGAQIVYLRLTCLYLTPRRAISKFPASKWRILHGRNIDIGIAGSERRGSPYINGYPDLYSSGERTRQRLV